MVVEVEVVDVEVDVEEEEEVSGVVEASREEVVEEEGEVSRDFDFESLDSDLKTIWTVDSVIDKQG